MHFHFILFLRLDVHCDSSTLRLKAEITPPNHRATFPPSVLEHHDSLSFWADDCYTKSTGNNVEGFCNINLDSNKIMTGSQCR